MLHFEFTVLRFFAVLPVAYVAGLLGSWLVHFVQHQRIAGLPLYLPHFQHHHLRVDDPDEWQRQIASRSRSAFWISLIGHGMWVFLSLCIIALYAVLFTPWVASVFAATGVAVGIFHWYLHQVGHDGSGGGWLAGSEWLQRERFFHEVHHLTSRDFANAKNFAFGDPLSKHVIDYVLGTLYGSGRAGALEGSTPKGVEMQLALAGPPCGPDADSPASEPK